MDESLNEKHKEWVVTAIDQIRQRKARPDMQRLCSALQRRHGLSKPKIQSMIEQLVAEKIIRKVYFKGQCSFRNTRHHLTNECLSTSSRIVTAIRAIMKETGDGVSFTDLEAWLIGKNPDTRLLKNRLEAALERELNANTVTKLSDNCYVLTESLPTKEKREEKPVVPTISPPLRKSSPEQKTDNGQVAVRKSGRPKKKKAEDPDYEVSSVVKLSRVERLSCDFCSRPAENKDGKKFLLICKDCNAKAHPVCMNYSEELAAKARNSPWQCIDCKVCYVCEGSGDANCLLFCDSCDKGYHMLCHNPALHNKPKGKWVCSKCKTEKKSPPSVKESKDVSATENTSGKKSTNQSEKSSEGTERESTEVDLSVSRRGRKRKLKENFGEFVGINKTRRSTTSSIDQSVKDTAEEEPHINGYTDGTEGASCLPTPSASPTLADTFDYQLKVSESVIPLHINDTSTYPNASRWSIDQVVQYFTELGFTGEATAFKQQEIDGKSLLLMKRDDVLTGLAIRLGPALKIYQKVYKLQTVGQLSS